MLIVMLNKLPLTLASGQFGDNKPALAEYLKKSIILLALAQMRLKPKGNYQKNFG